MWLTSSTCLGQPVFARQTTEGFTDHTPEMIGQDGVAVSGVDLLVFDVQVRPLQTHQSALEEPIHDLFVQTGRERLRSGALGDAEQVCLPRSRSANRDNIRVTGDPQPAELQGRVALPQRRTKDHGQENALKLQTGIFDRDDEPLQATPVVKDDELGGESTGAPRGSRIPQACHDYAPLPGAMNHVGIGACSDVIIPKKSPDAARLSPFSGIFPAPEKLAGESSPFIPPRWTQAQLPADRPEPDNESSRAPFAMGFHLGISGGDAATENPECRCWFSERNDALVRAETPAR